MAKTGRPRNEKLRKEVLLRLNAGSFQCDIVKELQTSKKLVRLVARDHGITPVRAKRPGRLPDLGRQGQIIERLRCGVTCLEVAREFSTSESYVHDLANKYGGMLPVLKERSPLRLSLQEREEISRCLVDQWSFRRIARHLDRNVSTISREVNANGGSHHYRAWAAERRCNEQAKRPKPAKLATNKQLRRQVETRLNKLHSPRQIALCLMAEFPNDSDMHVSHETIYQSLFIQGRGALRRELTKCLRTGRARRSPQRRETKAGRIKEMVMISERPAEVEDRAIPGHWEGDLIVGKDGKSAIGTLVERQTRYVMLLKLKDQTAETVRKALEKTVKRLPEELFKSLTWDQGKEMAEHATFSFNTDIDVYFCDPHSPWQRGSNENTNGLLRQYFPKGTDLSKHSQRKLDAIARELNERSRETLGLQTPAYMLSQLIVALTD
jgi:IS30 family transposase